MCPSLVGFSLLNPVIACFRRNLVVSLVHRLVLHTVESDSKFKGQSKKVLKATSKNTEIQVASYTNSILVLSRDREKAEFERFYPNQCENLNFPARTVHTAIVL